MAEVRKIRGNLGIISVGSYKQPKPRCQIIYELWERIQNLRWL
jgi:hypothetical protein